MPWEKTYDEATVLEAAMIAFWTHGYQGTSVADLVAATGLNRGSLYAGFGNKRALFLRALRYYDQTYRSGMLDQFREGREGKEAILTIFETVARGDARMPGGCLMVQTAMELSPHDPEIATIVEGSMAEVEAFFVTCLSQGDTPPPNAVEIAKVLQGLMIGILVMTRTNRDSPSVPAMLGQVRNLLG
ncbi:MAG: TetR/AcrR family transcriptional regulator [Roseovarius sp.]|jgi:TetR/AcrR family transcriptional repressor of nem operon|uniref:TetR/AcrR family transcriptional regulator n=1 Tax=Roseovarius sp. TaxID=1486281 RepID=UPI0032EDFAD7